MAPQLEVRIKNNKSCPNCLSPKIRKLSVYIGIKGLTQIWKCLSCKKIFKKIRRN